MAINKDLYDMIFKRKSFHLFKNIGNERLSEVEIEKIYKAYRSFEPLYADIKTEIRIVPNNETSCRRGQEYCILLYSEKNDNYLQNIGYLGQQLDLYLASQNIGSLWYGLGKTDVPALGELEFVIMFGIAKVDDASKFREDMYKSKRKTIDKIWSGEQIDGVSDIVRFAPSACNIQPWTVENRDGALVVYRYRKPGKMGIIPLNKIVFYNRIDIGIFLCFMDLCLMHCNIPFEVELFDDLGTDSVKTQVAVYKLK